MKRIMGSAVGCFIGAILFYLANDNFKVLATIAGAFAGGWVFYDLPDFISKASREMKVIPETAIEVFLRVLRPIPILYFIIPFFIATRILIWLYPEMAPSLAGKESIGQLLMAAFMIFVMLYIFTLALIARLSFDEWERILDSDDDWEIALERIGYNGWKFTKGLFWFFVRDLWLILFWVAILPAKIIWVTIKLAHSDQRVLCGIDALIAVSVWIYCITPITKEETIGLIFSALIGGAVGKIHFEIQKALKSRFVKVSAN